ncbi:SLOG family protein [Anaerotignum sp. MB30-C6]|uniref:SLOG family protein n=1 Tax=Anaerotignum sp. MB30-C6 TaxID=3070814 RepID=UPI0027DDC7DE|nr:SLOG family protein [Anaerotignum sp. MB30-C6]WMI81100.1 SLOG family protein [Anaerotignum sp. MB30-C6]
MQTIKEHSLCFTGHRSERLPRTEKEMVRLKDRLLAEIDKEIANGIDTFYFGACYGFDLLAGQMVLTRKKVIHLYDPDPRQIKLIAVIPYEEQASRWREKDRELYYDYLLPYCNEAITLHTKFQCGCYHEGNWYMVDRCNKMICYYDGGNGGTAYSVNYAKINGLEITNLYELLMFRVTHLGAPIKIKIRADI